MSKKILHIINDLSCNGGAQRFVIDLVTSPPEAFTFKIITLEDNNDFENELIQNNIDFYCWHKLTMKQKWQILRWPDLVHSHLFPSIYLGLASFGKKRIQTEHATHNHRRDYRLLKPLEYFLYSKYNATYCITEQVRKELECFLPQWKQRYHVIENGVDLSKFPLIAKEIKHVKKTRQKRNEKTLSPIKIGMVGRFHQYKDHTTLLRALTLLPEHYQLHFAGDGDTQQECKNLTEQLNLNNRVVFHGVLSNIPAFLSDLDLYIQSSIVEGFGLAAVEAMAAGLPVLGTKITGLKEVVGNEDYCFDVGNEKELAHKIEKILSSKREYKKASQYSVNQCQKFGVERFRNGYYQAYQEVLDEQIS